LLKALWPAVPARSALLGIVIEAGEPDRRCVTRRLGVGPFFGEVLALTDANDLTRLGRSAHGALRRPPGEVSPGEDFIGWVGVYQRRNGRSRRSIDRFLQGK
jgi:hypothetical protein